jgi:hypothetical protein
MIAFLKACWLNRWFRVWTWILTTLVTVLVLVEQCVNWKGGRAWRSAREDFVHEGETLDFRAIMPDPVPDQQNFCAIPALKDLAVVVDHDASKGSPGEKRKRMDSCRLPGGEMIKALGARPDLVASAALGIPTDLKSWADWLRAEGSLNVPPDSGNPARDLLAALSKHDAFVSELASALDRPEAQWTPAWKTRELPDIIFSIQLPHYNVLRGFVHMLCLRAVAAAQAGDAAKAHEALLVALRLTRTLLDDPFFIGALVAANQLQQIHSAIWQVSASHVGSADQFRRLQDELARLDVPPALLRTFRAELAGGIDALMWMKQKRDAQLMEILAGDNGQSRSSWTDGFMVKIIPSGWFDMNAATMVRLHFDHILKPLREGNLSALCTDTAFERELLERKTSRQLDSVIACLFFPSVSQIAPRMAYTQCQTNEAIIACALERWFMINGSYPDSLDAVSRDERKPLPLDVLAGKNMAYRKTPNGRYALWCVGINGKDDGGTRVLDVKKQENTKFYDRTYAGDWVWDFPK